MGSQTQSCRPPGHPSYSVQGAESPGPTALGSLLHGQPGAPSLPPLLSEPYNFSDSVELKTSLHTLPQDRPQWNQGLFPSAPHLQPSQCPLRHIPCPYGPASLLTVPLPLPPRLGLIRANQKIMSCLITD